MRSTGVKATLLALALSGVISCERETDPVAGSPGLVVLIVVDQLGAEQLARVEPLLTGGLRRLLDEGVVFTGARHAHAKTSTGPGHATLATGTHPSRHGIVHNYWNDRATGEEVYSAEDDDEVETPARLLAAGLGDWLKARSPASRVFAVSGKDRSAVLSGGLAADGAFWYDRELGTFETSRHYFAEEPEWLVEFNRRRLLDEHLGRAWVPLSVPEEALAAVGVETFDFGPLRTGFPHVFGGLSAGPSEGYYEGLYVSPWLDHYTTQFAEHLIESVRLGERDQDLLVLAYSAMDSVGHTYGPESRESLDTLMRLDLSLGRLLDFVDRRVGLDNTVIALSSDHGAAPLPELRARRGESGSRLGAAEIACFQRLGSELEARFGSGDWLLADALLDPAALERSGVAREVVEREVAAYLATCPNVERVVTRSQLLSPSSSEPTAAERNTYHPDRSADILVTMREHFMPTRTSASTHGTPWDYDAEVPLIFWKRGLTPATIAAPVATVDLAPTLAGLAGFAVTTPIDGADLGALVRGEVVPEAADTVAAATAAD